MIDLHRKAYEKLLQWKEREKGATAMSFYGVQLVVRASCIIFDELQLYPRARQMIKHLVADGRYDYIETGSLISIKQNVTSIDRFSEKYSSKVGEKYIVYTKDLKREGEIICIPAYMTLYL